MPGSGGRIDGGAGRQHELVVGLGRHLAGRDVAQIDGLLVRRDPDGLATRSHVDGELRAERPGTDGRPGSSACCSPPSSARSPQPVVDLYVASAKRDNGHARRSRSPPRRGARASRRSWSSPGRSIKGQLKQADRIGARYVAILGDEASRSRTWSRRAGDRGRQRQRGARAAREAAGVRQPRANTYRDAWAGELRADRRRQRASASPAGCTAAATTAA